MKPKNGMMLLLAAFIWGTAFVAQSVGMDYLGPFSFNGIRCFIGAIVLIPCIFLIDMMNKKNNAPKPIGTTKDLLVGGGCCGLLLFSASSLQQVGLQYTSAGKAGFITAFYIVIVPVLSIFLKKKTGWKVWVAVLIALVGLYCLCIKEGFTVETGDVLIFICALIFSGHILVVDHFSPRVDGVKMSCIQFFIAGVLSVPFMVISEHPTLTQTLAAWQPLLYAGVLSCGVAYTLQIVGQKNVNPAIASLLLSLESCFSVLAGWLVLGEIMSVKEYIGCVLMFAAIILAQLPEKAPAQVSAQES